MKDKSKKELILNGNMYKAIIALAFPIMINNLIQTLYNLADALWVNKLGSVEFAATSFVWPVIYLFISIGFGIFIAGTSILSQLVGSDRNKLANEYSAQLVAISMILSVIFSALGFLLTPYIVKFMGATGRFYDLSTTYLKWSLLDLPFMFLFFNINSIMSAEGNTVTPTILSAISALLNAILDPIFIFTLDLGIAGAAIATIISKIIIAVVGIYVVKKKDSLIRPDFRNFKFDKEKIRKILKVALPSSVGQSGSALGFIILNRFIASYGTSTVAAYGMVNRITSLITQATAGIGAGLTTIIGQNIGASKFDRVIEAFRKALVFTWTMGITGCVLIIMNNEFIIDLFMGGRQDIDIIVQASEYLNYSALFIPLMGMFGVLQGLFQGSGHTRYSMYMEVSRLWFVRLPMIIFFKNYTDLGSTGIWIAMSVSNLIVCIYGYLIYKTDRWKNRLETE